MSKLLTLTAGPNNIVTATVYLDTAEVSAWTDSILTSKDNTFVIDVSLSDQSGQAQGFCSGQAPLPPNPPLIACPAAMNTSNKCFLINCNRQAPAPGNYSGKASVKFCPASNPGCTGIPFINSDTVSSSLTFLGPISNGTTTRSITATSTLATANSANSSSTAVPSIISSPTPGTNTITTSLELNPNTSSTVLELPTNADNSSKSISPTLVGAIVVVLFAVLAVAGFVCCVRSQKIRRQRGQHFGDLFSPAKIRKSFGGGGRNTFIKLEELESRRPSAPPAVGPQYPVKTNSSVTNNNTEAVQISSSQPHPPQGGYVSQLQQPFYVMPPGYYDQHGNYHYYNSNQ